MSKSIDLPDYIKQFLRPLFRLFFVKQCPVCGGLLRNGEEVMCLKCEMGLPLTGFGATPGNPAEQLFWGKLPIERASSFFYYQKGNDYTQLILHLKYRGRKDIGRTLGRMAGEQLLKEGFFDGIDLLVPVPLHPRRLHQRGYNQSCCIAEGIAKATGIPVEPHCLRRIVNTQTQTHKQRVERWDTIQKAFALGPKAAIDGKHLLLIDDVLTTGATLTACAEAILQASTARISVFTLSMAHRR